MDSTVKTSEKQQQIDKENAAFWNELCGSLAAQELGIVDDSPASLKKWDDFFFSFYPYLLNRYLKRDFSNKKVLEVGLGYGSVGQRLGEQGALYHGLDIAAGPVQMMRHRYEQAGLEGKFVQGSMLGCPFENNQFDFLVSIGCFHHTGNVKRCIDEAYRVLKPGGEALIMVYNRYSFRQWRRWPKETAAYWLQSWKNEPLEVEALEAQRYGYDHNRAGAAAPETVFLGIAELRKLCTQFSSFRAHKENFDQLTFVRGRIEVPRRVLLKTCGKLFGTDIYIELKK